MTEVKIGNKIIVVEEWQEEDFCIEEDKVRVILWEEILTGYHINNYKTYNNAIKYFKKYLSNFLNKTSFEFFPKDEVFKQVMNDFEEDFNDELKVLKIKDFNKRLSNSLNEKLITRKVKI